MEQETFATEILSHISGLRHQILLKNITKDVSSQQLTFNSYFCIPDKKIKNEKETKLGKNSKTNLTNPEFLVNKSKEPNNA